MSESYHKIQIKKYSKARPDLDKTKIRYWKKYKNSLLRNLKFPIVECHFCESKEELLACAVGAKVNLYNTVSDELVSTFQSKSSVLTTKLRSDSKLLALGNKDGMIKIFQCETKIPLRTYNIHQGVNSIAFGISNIDLVSGSVNGDIQVFQISNENPIWSSRRAHKEIITQVEYLNNTLTQVISTSYDKTLKLWDIRESETNNPSMCINLEQEVEGFVSIGEEKVCLAVGSNAKLYDLRMGLETPHISTLAAHQKSIMGIAYCKSRDTLFTAGGDRILKFTHINSGKCVYSMKMPSEVVSLGVMGSGNGFAIGMGDGNLMVRSKNVMPKGEEGELGIGEAFPELGGPGESHAKGYKYFFRGSHIKASLIDDSTTQMSAHIPQYKLPSYDLHMKRFEYKKCLDSALATKDRTIIISVLEEFTKQNLLHSALKSRSPDELCVLLRFIKDTICDYKYKNRIIEYLSTIIDMYSPVIMLTKQTADLVKEILVIVNGEIELSQQYGAILGQLETLFTLFMITNQMEGKE